MGAAARDLELDFEILEYHTSDPFHIARLRSPSARHSAWIRIRDGDGLEGWGEAVAIPYYGETAQTIAAVLPRLAEAVRASAQGDPFAIQRIKAAVSASVGHTGGARAGISAALHDLVGKRLGVPVWRLLGGAPVSTISSFTIGIDEPETLRRKVRAASGYPCLKIKLGSGRDEEILALVREEAPQCRLRVDANTAWSVKEALAALPMLQDYGVEILEQQIGRAHV